mgnify:CR=1 FL=1
MAEKRDYYEVLGLSKGASDEDIKRAFKKQAKKYKEMLEGKLKRVDDYICYTNNFRKQRTERITQCAPFFYSMPALYQIGIHLLLTSIPSTSIYTTLSIILHY